MKNTAKKSSSKESPTVFWMPPLSSGISENSSVTVTPQAIGAWLISSRAGFPAKISPVQKQMDVDLKASLVASGEKCAKSLASLSRDKCSWKTAQCLLFEEEQELLPTLPAWGMTVGGELWALSRKWSLSESEHKLDGKRLPIQGEKHIEGNLRISPAQINFSDVTENWALAHGFGVRVVDDVADTMDRIKAIGNAQIPIRMAYAYEVLSQSSNQEVP